MTVTPHQAPIGSGFGPHSTAEEVIGDRRLDGHTAIVTGGASGLGLETARVLAAAGAHVVVPARDVAKARAAHAHHRGTFTFEALDLAVAASVDAFADRFIASGRPLDLLIGSAGVMATPEGRDADGNELQLATNHLGHFRLATRLWEPLRRAEGARVVSVSSLGHQIAGVDFEDPNFEHRAYDKWQAYGQSKSANALFAVGLDARGAGHGIHAFSLHPGTIWTGLARHLSDADLDALGVLDERGERITDGLKTIPQGAATIAWCATSPRLEGHGGAYCEDADVAEVVVADHHVTHGVRPWAIDAGAADRLWELSERLTQRG